LPELEAESAFIESEYNTLEAARNSRLVNEVGGAVGLTKQQLADRQNEIQRQYGLQVADNRINELAVAGKINAATKLIDAKMDLKYGDLEAEIDLYKSQLEALTPLFNKETQALSDQRQFMLNEASNIIQNARQTDKELELAKAQALKNAQDRGAGAFEMARIQDANSLQEVAATGFMTSALEQAQLANLQLSNQQLRQALSVDVANGVLDEKDIQNIDNSPQGKSIKALSDLKVKMNAYESLIEEVGTESFGADKKRLDNAYTELQLAYKEAANLGVLAGPDMELIETAIADATPGFFRSAFNIGTLGLGSALQTRNLKANLGQAQTTLNEAAQVNLNQLYARNPKYENSLYVDSLIVPFAQDLIGSEEIVEMDSILEGDGEFEVDFDIDLPISTEPTT